MAFRPPNAKTSLVHIGSVVGSSQLEFPILYAQQDLMITAVYLLNAADIASTASGGTLTIYDKGTDGTGTTSVGTVVSAKTGGIDAFEKSEVTLTATATKITAGRCVSAKWTEGSNSTDLTKASILVDYVEPYSGNLG